MVIRVSISLVRSCSGRTLARINAPFTVSGDEIDNSQYAAISFDGGSDASTIALSGVNINGAEFAFSNKVTRS